MSNLIKKAKRNKSEILNSSFNKYKINSPSKTFYTQKYIQSFEITYDINAFKTKSEFYLAYANHLSEELKKDNVFKRGELTIFEYLLNLAKYWCLVDKEEKTSKVSEDDRHIYLVRKFIIDCVDGLIREEIFYRKIKNFYKLPIEKTSPEDDAELCVDYFVELNGIKTGFQVKPISFFKGINSRKSYCMNSLKKIHTAFLNNRILIFFTYVDKNKLYFALRDKDKDCCNIVDEDTFFQLLQLDLTYKNLRVLSKITFQKMKSKIVFL